MRGVHLGILAISLLAGIVRAQPDDPVWAHANASYADDIGLFDFWRPISPKIFWGYKRSNNGAIGSPWHTHEYKLRTGSTMVRKYDGTLASYDDINAAALASDNDFHDGSIYTSLDTGFVDMGWDGEQLWYFYNALPSSIVETPAGVRYHIDLTQFVRVKMGLRVTRTGSGHLKVAPGDNVEGATVYFRQRPHPSIPLRYEWRYDYHTGPPWVYFGSEAGLPYATFEWFGPVNADAIPPDPIDPPADGVSGEPGVVIDYVAPVPTSPVPYEPSAFNGFTVEIGTLGDIQVGTKTVSVLGSVPAATWDLQWYLESSVKVLADAVMLAFAGATSIWMVINETRKELEGDRADAMDH